LQRRGGVKHRRIYKSHYHAVLRGDQLPLQRETNNLIINDTKMQKEFMQEAIKLSKENIEKQFG